MTPQQRVMAAAEMTDDVRALVEAGIRHRHPDFNDEAVRRAFVDALLGADVAEKVRERTARG